MKPVSLNQLLFHEKSDSLSFYRPPERESNAEELETFLNDMHEQLLLQGKEKLAAVLEKNKTQIKKVLKNHKDKSYGFFFSEDLIGYITLDTSVEAFCVIGATFHVRPLLEEFFINPEFMVVNVSLYDIKVYRGDFRHLEIFQQYEFDKLPKGFMDNIPQSRIFAPQYLGLIPFKTMIALKTIAHKIKDMLLYQSLPVIVTGLREIKDVFLRYFGDFGGLITSLHEDFYEQTCVQVLEGCKTFRSAVLDYYSVQLKERLKRLTKSKRILTELAEIIKAVAEERIIHLILPIETKIWGSIDFEKHHFEIHKKLKKDFSVDILNELAEAVVKQGGKIQFLRPHFFPQDSVVLGIVKG